MKLFGILAILLLPATLLAQNPPAATGGEATLWAGAEMTSMNPDYSCASSSPFRCSTQVIGSTAFFDFNPREKWGVEGEARWLDWHGEDGETISNYLIGGHYRGLEFGRLSGWVKFLVGGGWIQTPGYPEAGTLRGSYFTYVPGGTLEYRLTHKISLRGDYEYEFWPSFAGPPTYSSSGTLVQSNNGLTPNGFSVGVTYRILGQ